MERDRSLFSVTLNLTVAPSRGRLRRHSPGQQHRGKLKAVSGRTSISVPAEDARPRYKVSGDPSQFSGRDCSRGGQTAFLRDPLLVSWSAAAVRPSSDPGRGELPLGGPWGRGDGHRGRPHPKSRRGRPFHACRGPSTVQLPRPPQEPFTKAFLVV